MSQIAVPCANTPLMSTINIVGCSIEMHLLNTQFTAFFSYFFLNLKTVKGYSFEMKSIWRVNILHWTARRHSIHERYELFLGIDSFWTAFEINDKCFPSNAKIFPNYSQCGTFQRRMYFAWNWKFSFIHSFSHLFIHSFIQLFLQLM